MIFKKSKVLIDNILDPVSGKSLRGHFKESPILYNTESWAFCCATISPNLRNLTNGIGGMRNFPHTQNGYDFTGEGFSPRLVKTHISSDGNIDPPHLIPSYIFYLRNSPS